VDALGKLSRECDARTKEITAKIYTLARSEFNINSPKQLSEVLFVKLKLPVVKKTKTGFSTDEEVLSRLAAKHEIAQVILEYRQITKLRSTYIDALPKLADLKTNRLHATFNQTGAETGRLSSSNPNLQNIPIRTELGREIRRAFVPFDKNDELLSADYSQIELRVLAHLSEDENLIKAFKDGEDIHAYTAGLIFDVPEEKVDAQMRNAAKRVNFGIIYGISAFGLAKDLGVTNPEAQDFIDRYFLRYPKVKTFMDDQIKKAQELGYVTTVFNRRRYIPEINSKNIGLRQFAERQAINTPVQGSAADLMKMAMIKIAQLITREKLNSRMIITVHDELVFNVPFGERSRMVQLVREAMEHVWEFLVPITVSVKVGKNWLQMEKV
jgi:DNA polymerase-1